MKNGNSTNFKNQNAIKINQSNAKNNQRKFSKNLKTIKKVSNMKVLEIRKARLKPFEIAKVDNEGKEKCFILIGETKIKTEFRTFEEANRFIEKKPYELIFAISEAVYNFKSKNNGNN